MNRMNNRDIKCLVMIAAYNESDNIKNVVDDIIQNHSDYDYVIINDGSTDNTADILEANGYNYLSLSQNLGIGGAIQTGYKYAAKYGYDIAIQLDGDGQHDAAFLDDLIKPIIEKKADYVIGSRFIKKEGFQSSVLRRVGISFLSGLIRVLCSIKVLDVTSGFRAVNRLIIEDFASIYPSDYPEPEAIVDAAMKNRTIM